MNFFRISYSDISHLKGKLVYLHNGEDIGSGAFEKTKKAEIRILLPRAVGVVSVFATVYSEGMRVIAKKEARLVSSDGSGDVYSISLSGLDLGLYFFSLSMKTIAGELFGMKGKAREVVLCKEETGEHFQFSIVDFSDTRADSFKGGMIYHIFVDRFNRGGSVTVRDDAILLDKWEGAIPEYPPYPGAHLENNTFFGGTLYGIIEKLDYIKSLGTTLIYLSPIFEAYSNHKYDTGDYMKVDSMFGGDEALVELIREANERGIGIILDGVFNHTGSDSIYFNKSGRYSSLGAYQSKESPYYKWYDFQNHPDKYTCWWGIEILPRINPDVRECGDYIAGNGGVIEKYTSLGVKGFRLDVADELSDEFIARIRSKLCEASHSTLLYGEVWEDASNKIAYEKRKRYYLGKELDGVMNYPLRTGIIDFLKRKGKSSLEYALLDVTFNAPKCVRDLQMNLLGTHDTERIITILAGVDAEGKSNDVLARTYLTEDQKKLGIRLVRMAYTLLFTVPGIPTVFYGDEVGLEGYKDPFNRRPYPWKSGNTELCDFVTRLSAIRREGDVFRDGDLDVIYMDDEIVAFRRTKGGSSYLTVINNSSQDIKIELSSVSEAKLSGQKSRNVSVSSISSEIIKTTANSKIKILKI